nr:MAG TPA: 23S rRNA (uracil-5-)-methyltransferase [Caudoviricetes sp.]
MKGHTRLNFSEFRHTVHVETCVLLQRRTM